MAFIDDATRVLPFAAFDFSESTTAFLPVLKSALTRRGLPLRLYVDNGANYRSHQLALVCAKLGIALIHARPWQPAGKGKIERFFRTLRAAWLERLDADATSNLEALNRSLWAWVEGEYHQSPHRGIDGRTPLEQWALAGENVRYPGPDLDLDDLFLFEAKRRVMKDRSREPSRAPLRGRCHPRGALHHLALRPPGAGVAPPAGGTTGAPSGGHTPRRLRQYRRQARPLLLARPARRPRARAATVTARHAKAQGEELMYLRHFALTRLPFETPAHTDELFDSNSRREAETRLNHLIELRGIGLLTGEVGSGKTTVCRHVATVLHPGLYRLCYVSLTTGNVLDMYKSIAWELGLPTERSRATAYRAIRTEVTRLVCETKQLPVLVIDEAHHLRNDVLEDLRLLCNYEMDSENRLCVLLVGLTELRRRLAMAVHESLSQRLVVRHHLTGLDRDELDHYLTHRLRLAGCEIPLFEPPDRGAVPERARSATAHQPHRPLRP